MCLRTDYIHEYEYGLRFPLLSGTNSVTAKLITTRPKVDDKAKASDSNDDSYRWVLLQEGAPLTGEHYRELPATVREIFETVLYGNDGLSFLVDLGATQEYLLERRGNLYTLMHEGHEIKVMLASKLTSRDVLPTEQGVDDGGDLMAPGVMLLEATATAGPDPASHAAVARILASFAQRLMPLVQFKKA